MKANPLRTGQFIPTPFPPPAVGAENSVEGGLPAQPFVKQAPVRIILRADGCRHGSPVMTSTRSELLAGQSRPPNQIRVIATIASTTSFDWSSGTNSRVLY